MAPRQGFDRLPDAPPNAHHLKGHWPQLYLFLLFDSVRLRREPLVLKTYLTLVAGIVVASSVFVVVLVPGLHILGAIQDG